ncbi:fatty acid synthase-like [Zophobas morio]|uniref:fatty acid synthase-like n=1 Tax=Zophobas morio TaxID=2755281 RepID=UPI0030827F92
MISHIECRLTKNVPFFVIGYSFGTIVALELVSLLEDRGIFGTVILIDGSPTYLSSSVKENMGREDTELQMAIVYKVFSIVIPFDVLSEHQGALLKAKDLEQRIDVALALIPSEVPNKQKLDKQDKQIPVALYKRLKAIMNYTFGEKKIKSLVHLLKAKYSLVDDDDDYQLSKVSENLPQVVTINGDHVTILNNPDLINCINNIVTL